MTCTLPASTCREALNVAAETAGLETASSVSVSTDYLFLCVFKEKGIKKNLQFLMWLSFFINCLLFPRIIHFGTVFTMFCY